MILLDPEDHARNHPQGAVALGALVVAGGQAAELLAAVDQPLHSIAQPVERTVEPAPAALGGLARDGDPDPAPAARAADGPAAVALVAGDPPGAHAGSAPAGAPHRPRCQQPLEHRRLVRLARREHDGQGLAPARGPEVDLGRKAALAAAKGLGRRVPPLAPAACWCARTTVL